MIDNQHIEFSIILEFIYKNSGLDFSVYRHSMIERRMGKRLSSLNIDSYLHYLDYLKNHSEEMTALLDVLTINVTRFFRNTFTFEYIATHILPKIISKKKSSNNNQLRIWSAGCSTGEEPYSIAILINEILEKEGLDFNTMIFATDIDKKALQSAHKAVYSFENIKNVKYELLKKYFFDRNDSFILNPGIKQMVSFSQFDMLNKNTMIPSESIYGEFDIVFCRNLLIYINPLSHNRIFEKLCFSLVKNGILVLGKTETTASEFTRKFEDVTGMCNIYKKR